jgi:DTW domain-containing protein YfiP
LNPDARSVVLYPADGATVITPEWVASSPAPIDLLVPDGNWRQAKRALFREPMLQGLPRVCLPPGPPSRFRLRKQIQPGRMATFEAVARALGIIEGREIQAELERIFDIMVERTLWSRGQLAPEKVIGGIPAECFAQSYYWGSQGGSAGG